MLSIALLLLASISVKIEAVNYTSADYDAVTAFEGGRCELFVDEESNPCANSGVVGQVFIRGDLTMQQSKYIITESIESHGVLWL